MNLLNDITKNNRTSRAHILWYYTDCDKLNWWQGIFMRMLIWIKLGGYVK